MSTSFCVRCIFFSLPLCLSVCLVLYLFPSRGCFFAIFLPRRLFSAMYIWTPYPRSCIWPTAGIPEWTQIFPTAFNERLWLIRCWQCSRRRWTSVQTHAHNRIMQTWCLHKLQSFSTHWEVNRARFFNPTWFTSDILILWFPVISDNKQLLKWATKKNTVFLTERGF